ncbi:MAG: hypothetical protein ACRDQ1_16290 [Sciscionella sp.]
MRHRSSGKETVAHGTLGSRRPRSPYRGGVLVATVGVAVLVSACGGGGSTGPGVAHLGSSTSNPSPGDNTSADPLAYAQCMRAHGVPDFPDPDSQGRIKIQGGSGLDPNSPAFQSAAKACKAPAPGAGSPGPPAKFLAGTLKFSKCMRAHGLTDFPDPAAGNGGFTINLNGPKGDLNSNSPQFKAARKACAHYLPGGGHHKVTRGGS